MNIVKQKQVGSPRTVIQVEDTVVNEEGVGFTFTITVRGSNEGAAENDLREQINWVRKKLDTLEKEMEK